MAKRKSYQEQLDELEKKKKQLEARKRSLVARKTAEERKKHNKMLFETGRIVESVLGRPIKEEELPKVKKFLMAQEKRGRRFSKAIQIKNSQSMKKEE